jgi:hypothetical protein
MLSFREPRSPEAQFPRRPPLGSWVNRGDGLIVHMDAKGEKLLVYWRGL